MVFQLLFTTERHVDLDSHEQIPKLILVLHHTRTNEEELQLYLKVIILNRKEATPSSFGTHLAYINFLL